jgi:isocitrate lyase
MSTPHVNRANGLAPHLGSGIAYLRLPCCFIWSQLFQICSHQHHPIMFRNVIRRTVYRSTRKPRYSISINARCMSTSPALKSSLQPSNPPVSSVLPADAFQLLSESAKPSAEDALFEEQIQQVQTWWASERYKGIKRPYTAEDVVSKRGALQQTYPSSLMARKLFNLFKERAVEGKPVHTST